MRKKMRKHLILPSALLIALLFCGTVSASAEAAEAGNAAEETAEAAEAMETAEESDGAETEATAEAVQPDCSSWAVEEVSEAIVEGLVPEHLQSDYQQPVTRGELAELTAYYELWHEPEGTTLEEMWEKKDNQYDQWREQETSNPGFYRYYGENVFSDTNEELYNRMYQFHYIEGYPDGTFRPDDNVKRMEAAVLLWPVLSPHIGGHMTPAAWFTQAVYQFEDIDSIPEWSLYPVAWMWMYDCIKGYSDTIYGPEYPMTREQAIVTVLRMTKQEVK